MNSTTRNAFFAPALALGLALFFPARAEAAPGHLDSATRRSAGPHPRLLMLPAQRAAIRARLAREPYLTLFKRVASWAGRSVDGKDHDISPAQRAGNTARAAALLFYLDRTLDSAGKPAPFASAAARLAMGKKAAGLLLAMKTTSRAKGALGYIKDIHTAQELHMWGDTLDLLLGADKDALPGSDRAKAVQNVADLAADFYADFTSEPNYLLTRALINNHRAKSAGALGVAALALNGETFSSKKTDGRYDPARWLDFAMRYSDMCARDILTDTDFGNQEGPGYLAYGHQNLLGFIWAWHNYTGAAPYSLDWSPGAVPYYRFHATGRYTVPDLWSSPWLEGQLVWSVRLMLPDGTMPGYDDNSPGGRPFYFGALVRPGVASGPLLRWAWRRAGYSSSGSVDQAPLLLVTFDDRVEEASPVAAGLAPTQVMPHAGQILFRTGWGAEDTWAMILAEHGKAAGWAQNRWGDFVDGAAGHEHPDPGAFSLYAHGEHLAIDSGYMGWPDHGLVNGVDNHNIVLVDGKGPQLYRLVIPETEFKSGKVILKHPEQEGGYAPALDGMAYVTASDITVPGAQVAEVLTRYSVNLPGTEVRRRAAFLAGRFLVILDRVLTAYSGPGDSLDRHSYTFQLHGNGGGTSGGAFQQHGAGGVWARPGARLRAAVSSGHDLAATTRLAIHDPGNRKPATHAVLEATASARRGEAVRFVALLAPEKVDQAGTVVQITRCRPRPCIGWEDGQYRCAAWSGARRSIVGAAGGPPLLEAGGGAYCLGDGQLAGVFDEVGQAGGPMISGRFALDGTGKGAAAFSLALHRAGKGAPAATLDLPAVAGRAPTGACSFQQIKGSAGEARWRIAARAPGMVTSGPRLTLPVAHVRAPALAEGRPLVFALGAGVKLSGAGTCAPGGVKTWRWQITTRPELSRLGAGAAAGSELTLAPDLPGVYTVQLTVTAADGRQGETRFTFEVEGEPPWPDASGSKADAGLADTGPAPAGLAEGGCAGCAVAPASGRHPLLPWLILLALISRRRPAKRTLFKC